MARTRRSWNRRRVACAVLAVLAAGFLVARLDRATEHGRRAAPLGMRPTTAVGPARTALPVPPRPSARSDAAAAGTAARRFLGGYLALHGVGSLAAVTHAAPELQRELRRNRFRMTPAQEQTEPRVLHVNVAVQSPGSARGLVTLKSSGGPPFQLLLYLERRSRRWVVTRIGDA